MKKITNKLTLFITTLVLLLIPIGKMWASGGSEGTTITVYAVGGHITWASSTWDDATSTLKIDCRRQGNTDDFNTYGNAYLDAEMTNTGYTYCGHTIYSYSFKELYDGAQIRLKHYKNGVWQEDYKADWAGTSTINGKIYDGYYSDAHQWLTYGRDITIYAIPEDSHYALSNFTPGTHTLYANVKVGSTGSGEWLGTKPVFSKTSHKYNGNWIYKATVFAKYNVIVEMQFQQYNGSSFVKEYDCNPASEYSADAIDGKIFGGNVGGHTWYNYGTDITLDRQSGTTGSTSVTATVGSAMPSATMPTREGYTFGGYFTETDGEGTKYYNANGSSATNWIMDGPTTLYAKWTINSHDIDYTEPTNGSYTIKAGDASAVSADISDVNYGTTITLSATPANECYAFGSWTVTGATSGDAITVTNNQFSMPDEDVTVAASFTQVNLALNATVAAGYEPENTGEHSDKVTDGSEDGAWVTWVDQPTSDEWFYVDLGAFYQLSDIEVVWGGDYSTDYILQARQAAPANSTEAADDNSWVTLAEVTNASANSTKRTSVNGPARYVRLHSLSRSSNCIRVKEFRVFGTGTTTAYTTPTLSTAEVNSYPSGYRTVKLHLAGTDSKSTAIHTYKITDEEDNVSIVTTDGDDYVTISDLSWNERHTLTVQAMDPGALLSSSKDVAVLIWDPTENLALEKTVVAGYTNAGNAGEAPTSAVDGNTTSAWTTYGNETIADEWIYVDLGTYYQLSSIELLWGDVYSTDYVLQVRYGTPTSSQNSDESQWYTIAEVTDAVASSTKSTSVDVPARYVRMQSKTRSGGFLRLYEFRVYGSGFATADETAPVINTAAFNSLSADKKTVKIDVTFTEAGSAAGDIHWTVIDKNSTVHVATYSAGVLSVTEMPTGKNQSVTIYAMDEAANISAGKAVTIGDYVNPDDNLALDKTSYACVSINDGEGKAKANDGNESTDWTSWSNADHTNDWWYVDLGDFYDIRRIEVVWTNDKHSKNYSIQYRQNAPADNSGATSSEWDAISEFTSVTTGNKSADLGSTVGARYICMRSAECYATDPYQVRLKEIRVFGSSYGTPDDDAPSWTDANCAVTSAEESTITMTLEATDDNPENVYTYYINIDNGSTSKDYECTTTALSNAITITDAEFIEACQNYTITVKCYDHVGNEATKVFSDVVPSLSSETNIFSGASATVDTGTASVAIDGDTGTRWTTGDSGDDVSHWILVDAGAVRNISTLKIAWETACPKDYYIEGSVDGTNYYPLMHKTEVPSPTGGSFSSYTNYAFEDAIGVRYMKVRSVKNNTGWGMSIFEMQAYGACYEESDKPITTFARVVSQVVNDDVDGMNVTFEVGAYDYETTYANMRYKVSYTPDGGATTVLDNQTATSGQLTISDLAFSTDYTVVIKARDGEDGNLADNSIELNFSTQDNKSSLYFRNAMAWQDGGLDPDYRFAYVGGGSDVAYITVTPNVDDLQYRLFDDTDKDGEIDNPGDSWSTAGNQHLHNCNGKSVTFYAKDQDHFVSTADLVYVVGSSVKANESNALQMTQSGTTYYWEGPVTAGNKFKIIVKAQESENYAASAFTDHSRARIMADSATFTNSSSWGYAKLTFDMSTWEYEWTAADTFVYDNEGGEGDGKWSTAGNWLNNAVPTIDKDVILQQPVTVDMDHATAKSIVLDQSGDNTGKLTIQANKGLEVAGTITRTTDGSSYGPTREQDLVLESSAAGNASLIFENDENQATVQMYSKASISGSTWNWQYVGTPFTGSIPQYNYYGSWMYKWNGGWEVVTGSDVLEPFAGYCLTQESATTHVMGGTLVPTTSKSVTMAASTDMVLANSWTAPIYIGGFTSSTFTSTPATIYLFSTGMAKDGASEYVSGEEAGTYVTVPVNAAEYTGNEFIAPMQGFFVTTNEVGGAEGKITMKYDELVRPADSRGIVAGPMKAPKRAQENNRPAVLKMWANGSEYNDRVVILERADFSEGFDNGWDGKKMSFGSESPSVYVINAQGGYDAVSAIPDLEGTVVGFRAGADNNCTMTFSYEGDDTWYLNDLQAQKSTLISEQNSYAFTTSANDSEVRFIISATPIQKVATGIENGGLMNGENDGMVRKVLINDHIYIIRSGRIYSVDGAMIK